jgi:hypothetical protein
MLGSLSRTSKSNLLACGVIFIVTCSLFLLSRVTQVADSRYSMLVSHSLLTRGRIDLDGYVIPGFDPQQLAGMGDASYQLEMVNGHLYYYFPVGSSLLSIPCVAFMNTLGISVVQPDGTYNTLVENRIQRILAAVLMASLACLIFLTARLLLPIGLSMVIAFGCALGTQVASTASRALWSDTWGIVLLGIAVYMLLAHEARGRRLRPLLLASLLAWAYFVRPTNILSIVGVGVYIQLYHRPLVLRYALAAMAWLGGFICYSYYIFGQPLPDYYLANRLTFSSFGTALAGNLISPSRGLFVFVPMLLFVAYLLIRYAREAEPRKLIALALGIAAAHLIVISGFPKWWGGHSYGPRFTTGLIPWFALLGIVALRARLNSLEKQQPVRTNGRAKLEVLVGVALLLLSVAINMNGATNARTSTWNEKPVNVDLKPERVWDWRSPQFLAR